MVQARAIARRPFLGAIAVLTLAFVLAYAAPASSVNATATVSIFDDDAGQSLFSSATAMAPGHTYAECISVGATSGDPTDTVTLGAQSVTGSLARDLRVTIDVGTGGRYGNCAGFTRTARLYTGTLDQLGSTAVDTGWHPAVATSTSFRISVLLDPVSTQQNATASGSFAWTLTSSGTTPTSTATPTPTGSPTSPAPATSTAATTTATPTSTANSTASPTSEPSSTDSPSATASDSSPEATHAVTDPGRTPPPVWSSAPGPGPASVRPTPARTAGGSSSSTAAGVIGAGGGSSPSSVDSARTTFRPDLIIGGWASSVKSATVRARRAAVAVVASPQYPLTAIAMAVAFLLVQDLIDRRDPKLAVVSRRQRDNEIAFPDIFYRGGGA